MGLGERLKSVRKAKGLNLTQAADELGVARTAYRLWEKDATVPAPQYWEPVALWCEVSLVTLLSEAGFVEKKQEDVLRKLAAREWSRREKKPRG